MNISTSLYHGELVRLTRIEYQTDPATLAEWSKDAGLHRMFSTDPARPLSDELVKKQLEALEKEMDEGKDPQFYYHIRPLGEQRLVGWAKIHWIVWTSGTGNLQMVIGPSEQRRGYGADALTLLLRIAFEELNLHRLTVNIPSYNQAGIAILEKFGFVEEARRREVFARDGQRWDGLMFGLLCHEWRKEVLHES